MAQLKNQFEPIAELAAKVDTMQSTMATQDMVDRSKNEILETMKNLFSQSQGNKEPSGQGAIAGNKNGSSQSSGRGAAQPPALTSAVRRPPTGSHHHQEAVEKEREGTHPRPAQPRVIPSTAKKKRKRHPPHHG